MKNTVERIYVEAVESAMSHIKLSNKTQEQLNGVSKRNYTKVNQVLLISAKSENGFKSKEWFTQEQVTESGLSIKKDSKGTQLFSSKLTEDAEKTYTTEAGEVKPIINKTYRYYFVFNKDQLEEKKA